MTTERSVAVVGRTGEIIEQPTKIQALSVSPEYVQQTITSLALLQQLCKDVLVDNRDYGHIPGIAGKFLWDPGAALIISSFTCHVGKRRLLSLVDDGNKIAAIIEVPIIQMASGIEVGSGIGAASTYETKHKYRWVQRPDEWGYDEQSASKLKTRVDQESGKGEYRIPNPEHGELLNTIIKIASKRAEVDAAESLPGVASALRELFDNRARKQPDWKVFWAQTKQMGLTESQVHEILKTTSITEWTKAGKTLDDAIRLIADKMRQRAKKAQAPWDEPPETTETVASKPDDRQPKSQPLTKPGATEKMLLEIAERKGFTSTKTARQYLVKTYNIEELRIDTEPERVYDEVKAKEGWTN